MEDKYCQSCDVNFTSEGGKELPGSCCNMGPMSRPRTHAPPPKGEGLTPRSSQPTPMLAISVPYSLRELSNERKICKAIWKSLDFHHLKLLLLFSLENFWKTKAVKKFCICSCSPFSFWGMVYTEGTHWSVSFLSGNSLRSEVGHCGKNSTDGALNVLASHRPLFHLCVCERERETRLFTRLLQFKHARPAGNTRKNSADETRKQ